MLQMRRRSSRRSRRRSKKRRTSRRKSRSRRRTSRRRSITAVSGDTLFSGLSSGKPSPILDQFGRDLRTLSPLLNLGGGQSPRPFDLSGGQSPLALSLNQSGGGIKFCAMSEENFAKNYKNQYGPPKRSTLDKNSRDYKPSLGWFYEERKGRDGRKKLKRVQKQVTLYPYPIHKKDSDRYIDNVNPSGYRYYTRPQIIKFCAHEKRNNCSGDTYIYRRKSGRSKKNRRKRLTRACVVYTTNDDNRAFMSKSEYDSEMKMERSKHGRDKTTNTPRSRPTGTRSLASGNTAGSRFTPVNYGSEEYAQSLSILDNPTEALLNQATAVALTALEKRQNRSEKRSRNEQFDGTAFLDSLLGQSR